VTDREPDATTAVLESSQSGDMCEPTAPQPPDAVPVVPVPVPAHVQQPKPRAPAVTAGPEQQQQAQQQREPSPTTSSQPSEPPLSHAGAQEEPRTPLQRILHALRPRRRKPSRAQSAAEISETSEPAASARPAAIVVILDFVLRLTNRPFAFLSPGARHVVGLVAIVTLAIAAVTAVLAPLAPKNDAITFIRQKRAELDQPPPPPPAAQSEKPENADGSGH